MYSYTFRFQCNSNIVNVVDW